MYTSAIALLIVMLVIWLISLPLRDASIVDLVWGLGFVLVGWIHFAHATALTTQQLLLLSCVTIWGVRLSAYLAWRNVGKGEDKRYQRMRESMQPYFGWKSLFVVFLLQGVLIWVISLPLQLSFSPQVLAEGWTNWFIPGLVVWGVGFLFESVGDFQLARFQSIPHNKGKVLKQGLWKYTRHPNYFGDFLQWWGLYLLAISHGQHVWTIFSPLLMSFLLIKVSGVTLLESDLEHSKPEYAEYQKQTNAFFPWF